MNEHLRLFEGEATETPSTARGAAPLRAALDAFRDATGWELYTEVVDDFDRLPGPNELSVTQVRVAPADSERSNSTRIERMRAQRLGEAIQTLSTELQSARRALVHREAELATSMPVATHRDAREHLSARLTEILQAGAKMLGCSKAGVYMLDGDRLRLKLRAGWRIPRRRLLAPARPLESSAADVQAMSGSPVTLATSEQTTAWRAPEACGAAICVPISTSTLPLGTLWFFSLRERTFNARRIELARIVAGRVAAELEREVLLAETQRLSSLRNQLDEVARKSNSATHIPPQLDRWSIAGWTRRSTGIGSAFHAWDAARDATIWCAVGECGGRPLVGSHRASALAASVRAVWPRTKSPAALLTETNRLLWRRESGDAVATIAAARLTESGEVRLSCAGDPCVLLVTESGVRELVDIEPPLGLSGRLKPSERALQLPEGAALVLTTSGVRDALDERGKLFGAKGIADALRGANTSRAQTLADLLQDRLEAHLAPYCEADASAIVICRR